MEDNNVVEHLVMKLDIAREVAMSYLGTPYRWGGDDFSSFDCSGFTIEILKSVGLLERGVDMTAMGLAKRFSKFEMPYPITGSLVFYGRRAKEGETERCFKGLKITHVEYALDFLHSIGASGGGSNVKTVKDAIRENAFVKIRPIGNPIYIVNPFGVITK